MKNFKIFPCRLQRMSDVEYKRRGVTGTLASDLLVSETLAFLSGPNSGRQKKVRIGIPAFPGGGPPRPSLSAATAT